MLFRPTYLLLASTKKKNSPLPPPPSKFKYYNPNFKMVVSRKRKLPGKPGDNQPVFDKGPVEWLPRPVRLSYQQLDDVREWMMNETITGRMEDINAIRELNKEWSQHPLKPVFGDVEPKLPKNIFKANHLAYSRFIKRWHRANHPLVWGWLPKPSAGAPTPYHHDIQFYPENWKKMAGKQG